MDGPYAGDSGPYRVRSTSEAETSRVGAVVEAFVDLFKEVPEALGPDVREQLTQAVAVKFPS